MQEYLLYVKMIPFAEVQILFYLLGSLLFLLLCFKEIRSLMSDGFRPFKTNYRRLKRWNENRNKEQEKPAVYFRSK